jgi:cytochrome c-type biogenesis protein CcmF
MNGLLGHAGVLCALVGAVVAAALVGVGLLRRRPDLVRRGVDTTLVVLVGSLVAVGAMERALVTHDFSLAYVTADNSRETPVFYSVTGLWSALQGSILLWATILAGYVVLLARRQRRSGGDPVVAVALLVALGAAIFFYALMLGPSDPFTHTVGPIPADGAGPNALLQDNLLVAVHPVFLYLGFVGFTVPFAFAIASLVTGRVDERWLAETRRFAVLAFGFLSVGIVLGAWWSYETLGWGGFWGWDPVENAALLPWLTATAYLHSSMVQERRGLLRIWNLSLLIATYALTILGTFLTRSNVLQSVHSFSSSGIGKPLIAYFALIVLGGVGLIGWRGDRLASTGGIDAPVSREGAFLVNNLLFATFAFVVLVGTVLPLFVEAVNGQRISIGRPYFDAFGVPLGIALLFFMAVAPALPWRRASASVLRGRLAVPAWLAALTLVALVAGGVRGLTPLVAFTLGAFAAGSALRQLVLAARIAHRHGLGAWRGIVGRANGGMIVHLGVVVIAVGFTAATSFGHQTEITLSRGATGHFDGHAIRFEGWQRYDTGNQVGVAALMLTDGRLLRPRVGSFNGSAQGTGTPAIASGLVDDVYLSLTSVPQGTGTLTAPVTLDVFVQPLIIWLWIGGGLVGLGSLLAVVPGSRRRPTDPSTLPLPELAQALEPLEPLASLTPSR